MAHGRRANISLVAAVALGDSTALVLAAWLGNAADNFGVLVHRRQAGRRHVSLVSRHRAASRRRLADAGGGDGGSFVLLAVDREPRSSSRRSIPGASCSLWRSCRSSSIRAPRHAAAVGAGGNLRRVGDGQCHSPRGVRNVGAQSSELASEPTRVQPCRRLVAVGCGRVGPACQAPGLKKVGEAVLSWFGDERPTARTTARPA